MNKKVDYFEWSDAWVFTSLFTYGNAYKNIDLVQVLINGDVLNHAIFEYNELHSGLHKLVASQLIGIKGHKIKLTQLGIEARANALKHRGGLFERVNNTLKVINRLKIETNSDEIIAFEFLSEEKLNKAYQDYNSKFNSLR